MDPERIAVLRQPSEALLADTERRLDPLDAYRLTMKEGDHEK